MEITYQCKCPNFNGCAVVMRENLLIFGKWDMLKYLEVKKYHVNSLSSSSSGGRVVFILYVQLFYKV